MSNATLSIDSVLFEVGMKDLFVGDVTEPNPFGEGERIYNRVSNYKAVVALDNKYVFSVVAPSYRLVTNHTAVALGRICFDTVFGLSKAQDMELFNIRMPRSRSSCHIDYKHKGAVFHPFRGDEWFPYLRITNSYNRTFALNFDLGFCRGICKNGVIFGKNNIEFKFHHVQSAKEPIPTFKLRAGEFSALEAVFQKSLIRLEQYHVPRRFMLPLFCRVLKQHPATDSSSRQSRLNWQQKRDFVESKTRQYFDEMGENGYAALNVLTDFASRPFAMISADMQVNELQRRAGVWINEFVEAIEQRNFTFEAYLGEQLSAMT